MNFSHLRFPFRWIVTLIYLSFCLYNKIIHLIVASILWFDYLKGLRCFFLISIVRTEWNRKRSSFRTRTHGWIPSWRVRRMSFTHYPETRAKRSWSSSALYRARRKRCEDLFETLIYQLSYILIKSFICNSLTYYIVCHQVTRLQDQGNTLKKNNDSMQKSTEDMMNKLKEVHYHLPVLL